MGNPIINDPNRIATQVPTSHPNSLTGMTTAYRKLGTDPNGVDLAGGVGDIGAAISPGESSLWEGSQLGHNFLDAIELSRAEDGSLTVKASRWLDLSEITSGMTSEQATGFLARHQENIAAFLEPYGAHLGDPVDGSTLTAQFDLSEENLNDGETFPDDVDGLTRFVTDKSKVNDLAEHMGGDFQEQLGLYLDASDTMTDLAVGLTDVTYEASAAMSGWELPELLPAADYAGTTFLEHCQTIDGDEGARLMGELERRYTAIEDDALRAEIVRTGTLTAKTPIAKDVFETAVHGAMRAQFHAELPVSSFSASGTKSPWSEQADADRARGTAEANRQAGKVSIAVGDAQATILFEADKATRRFRAL